MKTKNITLVKKERFRPRYNVALGIYTVFMSSFAIAYTLVVLFNFN